ncbi:MAG: MFS transporter [Candidatus Sumerlaeaceae bacterium]
MTPSHSYTSSALESPSQDLSKSTVLAIITAALGFFVDAYDLLLYNIVRRASLADFGFSDDQIRTVGVHLLNSQLLGLLFGGILWGVLGDRRGRKSVLFGSITLYSIATLANAFVHSVPSYALWRFLAGVGLAGELGAGVTLVSELMSPRNRGYGTMIVAAVGVLGVVTASLIGDLFPWRYSYAIGGMLGFLLLALRIGVSESPMFARALQTTVARGNFFALFTSKERLRRYISLILVAMPVWYAIGILVTFSPELGKALGLNPAPKSSLALMFYYLALTFGDLVNGYLSQRLQTRKKIIAVFMALAMAFSAIYLLFGGLSLAFFYATCTALGFVSGYWAVFVTVAAEQFGTNLRATVAVTAPNFVRGLTAILTWLFNLIAAYTDIRNAAGFVGIGTFVLAATALSFIEETYGKDLDFIEKL